MDVTLKFDGACSIKQGIAAGAAIVYTPEGVELGRYALPLVETTTPVAEYTGLILGLRMARDLGATRVRAWGDAELIVRQVDGRYRCKDPKLRGMLGQVVRLRACFDYCEIMELPKSGPKNKRRHLNGDADALAGVVMRSQMPVYERSRC